MSPSSSVLLAAVALVGARGCLFTDPINRPPMIQIDGRHQILRGEEATYTAMASDPDGDRPIVEWTRTSTASRDGCDVDLQTPSRWPTSFLDQGESFTVVGQDTAASFCVWARATDRQGATAWDVFHVERLKPTPVALIEIVEAPPTMPYSLYADLKFTGANSQGDGEGTDVLRFSWNLVPPVGSAKTAEGDPCPDGDLDPSSRCLSPDVAGTYRIELTVIDMESGVPSIMAMQTFDVAPDRLPCLYTEPSADMLVQILDTDRPRTLRVTRVDDDGDPFPPAFPMSSRAGTPTFEWYMAEGSGSLMYQGNNLPEFPVPDRTLGEEVTVRVQVRDRDTKGRINGVFKNCGVEKSVCSGDQRVDCFQWVTWKIKYL